MDYAARAKELCRIFNNSSPEAERMAEEWLRAVIGELEDRIRRMDFLDCY